MALLLPSGAGITILSKRLQLLICRHTNPHSARRDCSEPRSWEPQNCQSYFPLQSPAN